MTQGNEKLLQARKEIEEILKRYDIGGHVVLHMPGFLENFGHYSPSYSRAKAEVDAQGRIIGIRVTSKLADYGGDNKARQNDWRDTSNMFSGMAVILGQDSISLLGVADKLDKAVGFSHTPLTPIDKQKG